MNANETQSGGLAEAIRQVERLSGCIEEDKRNVRLERIGFGEYEAASDDVIFETFDELAKGEDWTALDALDGQQEAYGAVLDVLRALARGESEGTTNERRTAHGRAMVETHSDLREDGIDFETAASDCVSDILHALFGVAPLIHPNHYHYPDGSLDRAASEHHEVAAAAAFLDRSLRSWIGDTEDEEG